MGFVKDKILKCTQIVEKTKQMWYNERRIDIGKYR